MFVDFLPPSFRNVSQKFVQLSQGIGGKNNWLGFGMHLGVLFKQTNNGPH